MHIVVLRECGVALYIGSYLQELENAYLHISSILGTMFLFILVPKHYINQNPNLKLYVSVYNHQPPPVLPWQLPSNFDHNSVKLICAKYKNE